MPSPTPRTLIEEFTAAQAWWRDAGVDQDFDDLATDWLTPNDPPPATSTGEPAYIAAPNDQKTSRVSIQAVEERGEAFGGENSRWPADLSTFQKWWLTEPSLDSGGSFPRIAPRGEVGAKLMIIVPEPEEQDSDELLSGPQGAFLHNMIGAMGLNVGEVYFAAALPRHIPMADWSQLQAAGLGKLLSHHITLAKPRRICALGRNIWPLLGHELAQGSANLPVFNHDGHTVPVLVAEGLSELLRTASRRKKFWHRWLEWTANNEP